MQDKKHACPEARTQDEQNEQEWRALTHFVLHRHAQLRFCVTVEQHTNPTHRFEADEARTEQGHWVEHEDAAQFAREFVATFGNHLSPYDIAQLIAALQAELADDLKLAQVPAPKG